MRPKGELWTPWRRTRSIAARHGIAGRAGEGPPGASWPWPSSPWWPAPAPRPRPGHHGATTTTTRERARARPRPGPPRPGSRPRRSPWVRSTTSPRRCPGLFKGAEDGTQAYFDYINSQGGVNGRMIKLDAQDSAYSTGTVANATRPRSRTTSPSSAASPSTTRPRSPSSRPPPCPTSPIPWTPTWANLPTSYSPAAQHRQRLPPHDLQDPEGRSSRTPDQAHGHPLGQRHPVHGVVREGLRAGRQVRGLQHRLRRRLHPGADDLPAQRPDHEVRRRPDVLHHRRCPTPTRPRVAEEMQQQNFNPIVVQGDAYSSNLVKDGGSAVNGMYIELGYVLYLGADSEPAGREALHQVDEDRRLQRQLRAPVPLRLGRRPALRPGLEARREPTHPGRSRGGAGQGHELQCRRAAPDVEPVRQRAGRLRRARPRSRTVRSSGSPPRRRPGSSAVQAATCRRPASSRRSGRPPRRRVRA